MLDENLEEHDFELAHSLPWKESSWKEHTLLFDDGKWRIALVRNMHIKVWEYVDGVKKAYCGIGKMPIKKNNFNGCYLISYYRNKNNTRQLSISEDPKEICEKLGVPIALEHFDVQDAMILAGRMRL